MSYRLEETESIAHGIRRVVREQIDKALDYLTDPDNLDEAIHDARKRCKKIRAAFRLVRDEIGEDVYKQENVWYRDVARRFAEMRDSFVYVETIDELKDHFNDQLYANAFGGIRKKLVRQHDAIRERFADEGVVEDVIATLREGRERLDTLPIEHDGVKAFQGGLRRVYKRGCHRFSDAYADPTPERFHEWRKRVKYLWYHSRLLRPVWTGVMKAKAETTHDLSDVLGLDHDLAELRALIKDDPGLCKDGRERDALFGLIDQRRATLQTKGIPHARRIYAEKPDAFVDRIATYWAAWRS